MTVLPHMAAQAGSNLCPTNKVCIYADNGYVGLLGYRGPGLGIADVSDGANDKTDSYENKTGTNGAWYYNADGGGTCYNMPSYSSNGNFGVYPSDELTSWRTNRGC